jgi:hypothetical protein
MVIVAGTRYERLAVVASVRNAKWRTRIRVRCDCGTEKEVEAGNLLNHGTRSCGCLGRSLARERCRLTGRANRKHGASHRVEYDAWLNMKQRHGLSAVCERWQQVESFYDDMGERPAEHSLRRIDPNGGFTPGNCLWRPRKRAGAALAGI